jgi:hypothetical protein
VQQALHLVKQVLAGPVNKPKKRWTNPKNDRKILNKNPTTVAPRTANKPQCRNLIHTQTVYAPIDTNGTTLQFFNNTQLPTNGENMPCAVPKPNFNPVNSM